MITPYYEDESVTLYCGDFREVLPDVLARHGEPDLTVTDPPYQETSLAWDRWPDGWPSLIPGRSMWCFGSLRMLLRRRDEFTGWRMSQDIVWEKHNGSGFARDRFRRVHEIATHWYRGSWADVHHDVPRVPGGDGNNHTRTNGHPKHAGKLNSPVTYTDDGMRLVRSVVRAQSMHARAIHPTEKPAAILAPLIRFGCPPGGLVFDPLAGSGSTLVAARALGCRAVGIEVRPEQCEAAVQHRLATQQLTLAAVGDADTALSPTGAPRGTGDEGGQDGSVSGGGGGRG